MRAALSVLMTAVLLSACGGGGGDDDGDGVTPTQPADSPAGLWRGQGPDGRTIGGLIEPNGDFWLFYTPVNTPNLYAGVFVGTSTYGSGQLRSTLARDFNLEGLGISTATVTATYVPESTFSPTVTFRQTQGTGTLRFLPEYRESASTAAIAGSYAGDSLGASATLSIQSNGALTGSSEGCNYTGMLTPQTGGNYYRVSVTFAPNGCALPGSTLQGVAFFEAATRRVYSILANSARTDGTVFVGTRQ